MKTLLNKFLPQSFINFLKYYLSFWRLYKARRFEVETYVPAVQQNKPKILFYDLAGLSFGGTQKFLQILAKYLNKDLFDVYFMYSSKRAADRLGYLEGSGVKFIDFTFDYIQKKLPFYIQGMRPHIFDAVKENRIDLLIVAGAGYPEFPAANLTKLPIVYINIFGSVNPQSNIKKYLCISDYLTGRVSSVLRGRDVETFYIQSEGPDAKALERGRFLRSSLGLKDEVMVFGRIGRPDDNIFDPIGIEAFKSILKKYPEACYLIMAPPPILEAKVRSEGIPNVFFVPPSGKEDDIWAFHNAIDVLAHFRYDGETMGLNIAESMLCGKPIITHKSRIWNAHLEYLDDSFSRIAELDNVSQYAQFMELFIKFKKQGKLQEIGEKAKQKAESLFLIKNNINKFEKCLQKVVSQK